MNTFSIIVVDDEKTIRDGISMVLDETYQVATYPDAEKALAAMQKDQPDLVLLDIGLPGMSGIEGVRILKEQHPSLQFLMLSVYEDDERIFKAICAGASGYLLKKTPPARLLESLRETVEGGSPMSPEIARRVITLFRKFRPPERAETDLTPHEVRILKLLVQGHHYKSAAAELGVSVNTVATHIKHIYEKLQVHSKSEAVARALLDGLID